MRFEFFVEGAVENTMLSIFLPQVLGEYKTEHIWNIHPHNGIGRLPENEKEKVLFQGSLLGELPAKIRALAKSVSKDCRIVVLVDLDDKEEKKFLAELEKLTIDYPELKIKFCFAIEELEAWFLGDSNAIFSAYPDTDQKILEQYCQDEICDTWEVLANAIQKEILQERKRSRKILQAKRKWAASISPYLTVERNQSPSFQRFVADVRELMV